MTRLTADKLKTIRSQLEHILWIGGGSGAGKTTMARQLQGRHGFGIYDTDAAMSAHADRCAPKDCPSIVEFARMTMDDRWVQRTPEVMLETFHWFRGEAFGCIIEDLLQLSRQPRVIVEGFRLLPHLVQPLMTRAEQAVWLLPTPGFRRTAFETRGGLWYIAGRTSDPAKALQNLLTRDAMFTDRLQGEIAHLGLNSIQVDQSMSEDDLLRHIEPFSVGVFMAV